MDMVGYGRYAASDDIMRILPHSPFLSFPALLALRLPGLAPAAIASSVLCLERATALSFICEPKSLQRWAVARQCTPMIRSILAAGIFSNLLKTSKPALLMSTSTLYPFSTVQSKTAWEA